MDVQDLKIHIIDNNLVEDVLESIECHHIVNHGEYFTCGNPDGDNKQAITVYINDNLTCVNYTRELSKNKRATDIFDLVMFCKNCTFPEALKFVCTQFGLDYYSEPEDKPESLYILELLRGMAIGQNDYNDKPLKPISEKILSYYLPFCAKLFEDDGISLGVQKEFGIGYDQQSNRITIPIRDSIGNLVGVKGRYNSLKVPDGVCKYLYLERCNKSKLLYGYYENINYIKDDNCVFVFESEKAVLQLASYGFRNSVAVGSKTISKTQIELLVRMGTRIVFCFDKDVLIDELQDIASMFMEGIDIYAVVDTNDILDEKESPSDDEGKFRYLIDNCIQKIK